jgi:GTP cyclohydrolase II
MALEITDEYRAELLECGLDVGFLAGASAVHGPARLPLEAGGHRVHFDLFEVDFGRERYIVARLGDVTGPEPALLRIESACIFGHVFESRQCDCGWQWRTGLVRIAEAGRGLLVYAVDQDARGLGIAAHFDIYKLRQRDALDTDEVFRRLDAPWDNRDYAPVPRMLRGFGVSAIALMSNNRSRLAMLQEAGFSVTRAALQAELTVHNMSTLMLEKEDLGYAWTFATHADVLEPLQAAVLESPELTAAAFAVPGELPDRRLVAPADEVHGQVLELAEDIDPAARELLYLTDLPRIDELPGYAEVGVRTLVVPFPVLPPLLAAAAEQARIRLVDWSRRNAWAAPRAQWVPVAAQAGEHVYARVVDGFAHPAADAPRRSVRFEAESGVWRLERQGAIR